MSILKCNLITGTSFLESDYVSFSGAEVVQYIYRSVQFQLSVIGDINVVREAPTVYAFTISPPMCLKQRAFSLTTNSSCSRGDISLIMHAVVKSK